MSAHIEWASARYTVVEGVAHPRAFEGNDGSANAVAALRLTYGSDGDCLVIEGRPEDLLTVGRRIVEAAQAIVVETVRTPELRQMYGEMAEASQAGTGQNLSAMQEKFEVIAATDEGYADLVNGRARLEEGS